MTKMARDDRFLEFLFAFAILCCMQVQVSPRPNPTSPDFNFVLHEEYLAFGEWVGGEDFPIENMSLVIANKQLQLRCFQELRNQRSPLRYLLNDTEGFYVTTVEKFDALYGTWTIRAKLPSKVQGTMNMALTNANCRPPLCPPKIAPPATLLMLKPEYEDYMKVDTVYTLSNGTLDEAPRGTRKLKKYEDSFHTYEIIWQPDSLQWRIDGKVVTGVFDPAMVPQKKMAFFVSAACPDDLTQSIDEDSFLTISSIVYTPFSSNSLTLPIPNPTTPDFNFVLHDEYLAFGEWIGSEDFPIDDMSPALANKQLQVRCFQELRQRRYQPRDNGTDGFYVSTVEKFDALYGTWTIRAKLPSKVQTSMRLGLTDAHCRPATCPPLVWPPATVMRLHPLIDPYIQFQTAFTLDNGTVDQSFRGAKKLPKYEDSFHTYEIIWQPDSLEWRIDGKIVAGYFEAAMIPQERMAFHVGVFCPDDDFTQSFDEDSSFTISSIVYTPFSSGSPTPSPSTTTSSTSESVDLFGFRRTLDRTTASPSTSWRKSTTEEPSKLTTKWPFRSWTSALTGARATTRRPLFSIRGSPSLGLDQRTPESTTSSSTRTTTSSYTTEGYQEILDMIRSADSTFLSSTTSSIKSRQLTTKWPSASWTPARANLPASSLALDDPRSDGLETTTAAPLTLDRSVELIADQYKIIVDAIKNITAIAIRINNEQWMNDRGLAKSKSNDWGPSIV